MKWVKYLQDDGSAKAGEILQIEDGEFATLKRLKFIEEAPEPTEVTAQAAELVKGLQTVVQKEVQAGIAEAIKGLGAVGTSRRPNGQIASHDNALDDPTSGFKTVSEFYKSVRVACQNGALDERLKVSQKAAGASEDINADGGYATPVQYAKVVFDDILEQSNLMQDCDLIPMESNSIKLPAINYLTQGQYGVTAYWEGEAQAIPPSKPNFRQPALNLNKLTALVPVTSELMEDGLAIESIINNLSAEAMVYKINDAILNGTGADQPVGIIGHASTVSVTRTTALAVSGADLITMKSRLYSNKGGKLYINKDVEPSMYQIQDPAGRWLYFAPGTFADTPNGKALGFEVEPVYNCQSVGNKGDVILANLKSNYALGYKSSGINKAMSIHLYFNTDQVAYRWTFRMDGRPWRDTTLASANGSATYGTAVVLSTKLS